MCSLAEGEKRSLLAVARSSPTSTVGGLPPVEHFPNDSVLIEPGGAFVTLFKAKRLRGCIGQLHGSHSLVEIVAHCARAVATEDPRSSRIKVDELPQIEIGKHGLLVANGKRRGVLLPQAALQFHWNPQRFLEATCEKAGLPRNT